MAKTPKSYKKQLLNGGELFVNRMGSSGYSVDVWDMEQTSAEDPVYHAFYSTYEEAMSDAALWAPWPES